MKETEDWYEMAADVAAAYGFSREQSDVSAFELFSKDDMRIICDLAAHFKKTPWEICRGLHDMAGYAQTGLNWIRQFLIEMPK